jgi:eukaryotic-like serine/threonine-protein kinase
LQRGGTSRLTFDPGDDLNPTWSPDSARIAFTSDRRGHCNIYVKPANGAGEERMLLQSSEDKSVEDWSPDGQYLLHGSDTWESVFSLRERKSIPLPKFTEDQARFSPNHRGPPRWLAYSSRETGVQQVYVRSFAGALSGSGGRWQISLHGGSEPIWRGDGPDGESFEKGTAKELFEAPLAVEGRNNYAVSADGKRFLVNVRVEDKSTPEFTVILDWRAGLKK